MTVPKEELAPSKTVTPKQTRPGGTGIWAPVRPLPGEQEWVVQADDDPLIVRSVD